MTFRKEACIETIRCFDSQLENIDFHNRRMHLTQQKLFGTQVFSDLKELIKIPTLLEPQVYKCRVTYRDRVEAIEWEPYNKRNVASLQVIHNETIDYSFKYRLRHDLDRIYSQKKQHDDVLIVRNGYLTDTYVCNIALFYDNTWWTPSNPLLNGTQRELLLRDNQIVATPILLKDLRNFTHIRLFNAMIPWSEAIELPVSQIFEHDS